MVLSGCWGGDDGKSAAGDPTKTTTAVKEKAGGKDSSIKVDKLDPNDVIAKQTVNMREKPEDTVEFGLQSLTVEGSIATLRLVVTPASSRRARTRRSACLTSIRRPSFRSTCWTGRT